MYKLDSHSVGPPHHLLPSLAIDLKQLKSLVGSRGAFVGIVFSLLLGPAAAVLVLILVAKPAGPLSLESNTAFWVLASIALGFAIVGGSVLLTWFLRLVFRFYTALVCGLATPDDEAEIDDLIDALERSVIDGEQGSHQGAWGRDSGERVNCR